MKKKSPPKKSGKGPFELKGQSKMAKGPSSKKKGRAKKR